MANLTIYSRRTSIARGNFWQAERQATEQNVQEWLKVFRADEPNVLFLASNRKPKN